MNKALSAFYKVSNDIALTEIRSEDADFIIAHISDLEIYNNTLTIPFPYAKRDALEYIDISRKFEFHHHQICNYAIRKNGELIGSIGLLFNFGTDSHKSEFGYWLSRHHRNQGIMTKVIRTFTSICFEEKLLFRIEANVFVENMASQRVLEKCGFVKEGLIKSAFVKDDTLKDTFLYAMVRAI